MNLLDSHVARWREHHATRAIARCVEEGDCLLWPGAANDRGPVRTIGQKQFSLRRLVWEHLNGRSFPEGKLASIGCRNPACLAHVQPKTWAENNSRVTSLACRMRISLAKRAACKITDEAVQEIRIGGESATEAAARHGISTGYVYMLRRGQFRRYSAPNPFEGLGA